MKSSTQYEALDRLILDWLKVESLAFTHLWAGEIRAETERLDRATGREAYRIMDSALQRLRKRGAIEHADGWWRLTK